MSAFAFVGARTMRGLLPAPLLRGPLGGELATPAREYRIPPHYTNAFAKAPLTGRDDSYI